MAARPTSAVSRPAIQNAPSDATSWTMNAAASVARNASGSRSLPWRAMTSGGPVVPVDAAPVADDHQQDEAGGDHVVRDDARLRADQHGEQRHGDQGETEPARGL